MTAHLYDPHELGGPCLLCGQPANAPMHIDAPGRTPLRADAGETMSESHAARAMGKKRRMAYEAADAAAKRGDPACDHDIEDETGLIHEHASGARNGLVLDRLLTLIFDPNGKRHDLKRLINGKKVTVHRGPWLTKCSPHVDVKVPVLVWVPLDGPFGGYDERLWTPPVKKVRRVDRLPEDDDE